jgi:hypothetical protein
MANRMGDGQEREGEICIVNGGLVMSEFELLEWLL